MDPAAAGKTYPDVAFRVDPERVAAFRALFGMTNGVPPTFATAAEFEVFPTIVSDPDLALDLARVVHGSQEYVVHRQLVAGETVAIRAHIDSIRMRGGSGFLTIVTELVGTDGDVAVTGRSMMIERPAGP
jgi:N-terminal half of MaoC dehydratase